MNVNRQVIASTLVIMAVGMVHAWTAKPPQGITVVVMGGYGLMLVLSIVDMFGGGLARLAGALSLLAVVFVLLVEGLPILQQIGFLQRGPEQQGPTAIKDTGSTGNTGRSGVNPGTQTGGL